MQVSSTNSLTWLQSASGAAASAAASSSASSAGGQDPIDASGAEGASPSTLLASLQSPSQQFSAGGLSALISAQLDQSATLATQDPAISDPSDATQSGGGQGGGAQGLAASGMHQHHHRRGGGLGHIQPQSLDSSSSSTAAATSSTSDAETGMAQLLTGM